MRKLLDNILSSLLAMIILIMFGQVIFRYGLNNSLTWSEEITKFLFIWITFLGTALCFRDNIHIGVEFLIEKMSRKWQFFGKLFEIGLLTVFNAFLVITGFMWVKDVSGTLSPATGLPLNIVFYAALPVSATLSTAFCINRFVKLIRGNQQTR
jgi:TRAP-type transport system small permease protein